MKEVFVNGCKAGVVAGLLWGVCLLLGSSPIILEAETYETAHSHTSGVQLDQIRHSTSGFFEQALSLVDSPESLQRSLLTLLGTVLLGVAFGLLASLGYALVSRFFDHSPGRSPSPWKPSPLAALLGGLIGFAVFHGIPSLGLQPNLPGIIGAAQDFSARQNWWIYSVSCSLVGVVSFPLFAQFLKNKIQAPVISAALISLGCIALPFITGVPEYSKLSLAPEALRVRFAWMTLGTTALFWVFLNLTLAHFLNAPQKSPQ